MSKPAYKRILLKLSGEILAGGRGYGIDPAITSEICNKIKIVLDMGIEVGIVIGGGNIFRGISAAANGMDRVAGDYLGMMATIMNSVALQSALENLDCDTRVMSALSITQLAEPYIRRRATRHLEKGRVVVFAGGTGNPYFTTDTAAVLRAIEINADVVIKGTKVDGVYTDDPMTNSDATRYDSLSYKEVIEKELRVMDLTAVTLCKENKLPIIVFDISSKTGLVDIVNSISVGTTVS
ncbi:MAG: UMP kinase [Candidatus Marinimicrobia bacterium]|jgi:uridylate kinase|nr:UMP kinase [Candidatus Neomarinimicrobiota bacterium]MBT5955739.1 UMP kinase [Candidatus Neomarinimicrobiota bacterium]MBT6871590.1 UMP kinase [Candidatus Neomarinimicrobiota bacterium]|tara:strand:+ start:11385 stop:12098 length:714 start_codon:yes stop_codon:yes gene_type:complete